MSVAKLSTPSLTPGKEYDHYVEEVKLWQVVTEVDKGKQAVWLALALPDDHPDGLKVKVMGEELGAAKLSGNDGVKNYLAFLDKIYKKDNFVEMYEAYRKVEHFKREKQVSIEKYIMEFNSLMLKAEKKGMVYPMIIKAFKLLEGSKTTELEKQMIISNVKYDQTNTDLFKEMEASMKKVAGELRTLGRGEAGRITVEDVEALAVENADVFAAAGFKPRRRSYSDSKVPNGKNPINKDGERLSCFFCGSFDHLKPNCTGFREYKEKLKKEKGSRWKDDKDEKKKDEKKSEKPKTTITLFTKRNEASSEATIAVAATGVENEEEVLSEWQEMELEWLEVLGQPREEQPDPGNTHSRPAMQLAKPGSVCSSNAGLGTSDALSASADCCQVTATKVAGTELAAAPLSEEHKPEDTDKQEMEPEVPAAVSGEDPDPGITYSRPAMQLAKPGVGSSDSTVLVTSKSVLAGGDGGQETGGLEGAGPDRIVHKLEDTDKQEMKLEWPEVPAAVLREEQPDPGITHSRPAMQLAKPGARSSSKNVCVSSDPIFPGGKDEDGTAVVLLCKDSDMLEQGMAVVLMSDDCNILEDGVAVVLMSEDCRGRAVLDTACNKDVCGESWLSAYMDSLDEEMLSKVKKFPGYRTFKFGGGEKLKSLAEVELPAYFGDQPVMLRVDVVSSELPLLLSLDTLRMAGTVLDMAKDVAIITGNRIQLDRTSSGHYALDLSGEKEAQCMVTYTLEKEEEWRPALKKLHEQFAHPKHRRLRWLIEQAGRWKPGMEAVLQDIEDKCELLQCRLPVPSKSTKPVVAFPRATRFNELLSLDLKLRHLKKPILYMIDTFSRLTLAEIIPNKKAMTVSEAIVRRWVGGGHGAPAGIHSDNGGEFTGSELISVAENLNCTLTTTAGRTPFQNGINERGHAVVDRMMTIILEGNPQMSEEVALHWACNAKNCLQMYSGLSSYQLVYGKNPDLPSNLVNNAPALEGRTNSELFAENLTALHAAREAHLKAESDMRLKKALRHNVRATGDIKNLGDMVYFKRMEDRGWRGPGRVVGIDRKNILVKLSSHIFNVRGDDAVRMGEENRGVGKEEELQVSSKAAAGEEKEEEVAEWIGGKKGGEVAGNDTESVPDLPTADPEAGPPLPAEEDAAPTEVETEGRIEKQSSRRNNIKASMQVELRVEDGSWLEGEVIKRTSKATSKTYPNNWMVRTKTGENLEVDFNQFQWRKKEEAQVFLTLVPRELHKRESVLKAKEKELQLLVDFDTYEEVNKEDMNADGELLSSTWVVSEKEVDGERVTKARLCA